MNVFDILSLICGLALFLYGMNAMGDALKKSAGSGLKTILGKLTSSPVKGFLLGLGVTAVIQSSSATTVMVIGFVNSGTMTLMQAVGVVMGANVGTAVTAWLTGLSGLGEGGAAAASFIQWLKPDAWMPILALVGICLIMFSKRSKRKDIGTVLLGFAVLMVGMSMMSDAVGALKDSDEFKSILTAFENPIFGVLAGLVMTAIVQSSSAAVGILQSLSVTGALTYGTAIPIIMGLNIGASVPALLSSFGANKNGKRVAVIYLCFNALGTIVYLSLFYLFDALFQFAFVDQVIDMWGIAIVHTVFKLLCVLLLGPLYRQLVKLSELIVPDKKNEIETVTLLDERLLETPGVAVARAAEVTAQMVDVSTDALLKSLDLSEHYDFKLAEEIRAFENKADQLEDALGTYLVKISSQSMNEKDSAQITKLLHIIGDYERISDHAVNIVESAEELKDKKINFSPDAQHEMSVLRNALREILQKTRDAYHTNDLALAAGVEPIEQVMDDLSNQVKLNHIHRLQKNECTIELGFVLNDYLINFERVSDHCSNIASCIIEISEYGALDMHKYIADLRVDSEDYGKMYQEYKEKYSI